VIRRERVERVIGSAWDCHNMALVGDRSREALDRCRLLGGDGDAATIISAELVGRFEDSRHGGILEHGPRVPMGWQMPHVHAEQRPAAVKDGVRQFHNFRSELKELAECLAIGSQQAAIKAALKCCTLRRQQTRILEHVVELWPIELAAMREHSGLWLKRSISEVTLQSIHLWSISGRIWKVCCLCHLRATLKQGVCPSEQWLASKEAITTQPDACVSRRSPPDEWRVERCGTQLGIKDDEYPVANLLWTVIVANDIRTIAARCR
jgi:hypothetical protein